MSTIFCRVCHMTLWNRPFAIIDHRVGPCHQNNLERLRQARQSHPYASRYEPICEDILGNSPPGTPIFRPQPPGVIDLSVSNNYNNSSETYSDNFNDNDNNNNNNYSDISSDNSNDNYSNYSENHSNNYIDDYSNNYNYNDSNNSNNYNYNDGNFTGNYNNYNNTSDAHTIEFSLASLVHGENMKTNTSTIRMDTSHLPNLMAPEGVIVPVPAESMNFVLCALLNVPVLESTREVPETTEEIPETKKNILEAREEIPETREEVTSTSTPKHTFIKAKRQRPKIDPKLVARIRNKSKVKAPRQIVTRFHILRKYKLKKRIIQPAKIEAQAQTQLPITQEQQAQEQQEQEQEAEFDSIFIKMEMDAQENVDEIGQVCQDHDQQEQEQEVESDSVHGNEGMNFDVNDYLNNGEGQGLWGWRWLPVNGNRHRVTEHHVETNSFEPQHLWLYPKYSNSNSNRQQHYAEVNQHFQSSNGDELAMDNIEDMEGRGQQERSESDGNGPVHIFRPWE